jgi:cellulose synthase/poly-beta-1,6-N-acetylglucosamine synthase-like glycosyltransferase
MLKFFPTYTSRTRYLITTLFHSSVHFFLFQLKVFIETSHIFISIRLYFILTILITEDGPQPSILSDCNFNSSAGEVSGTQGLWEGGWAGTSVRDPESQEREHESLTFYLDFFIIIFFCVMICQHFVPGPPRFYKAEQYCFGARGQTETFLKIVDSSWKYKKNNNEKI